MNDKQIELLNNKLAEMKASLTKPTSRIEATSMITLPSLKDGTMKRYNLHSCKLHELIYCLSRLQSMNDRMFELYKTFNITPPKKSEFHIFGYSAAQWESTFKYFIDKKKNEAFESKN